MSMYEYEHICVKANACISIYHVQIWQLSYYYKKEFEVEVLFCVHLDFFHPIQYGFLPSIKFKNIFSNILKDIYDEHHIKISSCFL